MAPDEAQLVVGEQPSGLRVAELDELERDVLVLAESGTFEAVATLLWTSRDSEPGDLWRARPDGVERAVAARSGLPADLLPLDRLQLIVTALATADPLRHHLGAEGVTGTARALIAGLVEALPPARPPARGGRLAERLWDRLCPRPAEPGLLRAFESAMVLLADHELAASTVVARAAASVRADPYAVVASGLGVASGPLHGGASYGAERLLAEAARRRLPAPNVDFALGAAAGLVPGAGEAIFAVARTAGWLAHGLEEYGRGGPLRPRAVSTGPPVPAG